MLVAHARARRGPGMRVSAGIQARSPRLILTLFEPDGALMGHCNSKQRRAYRLIKGMPLGKKATVGFRVMIAIGLRRTGGAGRACLGGGRAVAQTLPGLTGALCGPFPARPRLARPPQARLASLSRMPPC